MSMPALSSTTLALIDQSPFLQIASSRDRYPSAPGEGLPLLVVKTQAFEAVVAFQGAQLLSFVPNSGEDLLWLSPNCVFSEGVALRGGVPVCFPWFGPHETEAKAVKHGFARNNLWQLSSVSASTDNEMELLFSFSSTHHPHFPHAFSATLRMVLAASAKLELTVTNNGEDTFSTSWALHSYHPVSNLDAVEIPALAGKPYLDNLEKHARKQQNGPLQFHGEVDRVFPAVTESLVIENSQPRIRIDHHNAPSVVTWNPGATNAANISDIGAGQEQHYICVERGAVLAEKWNVAAGASISGGLEISKA
jgi:glucose-6-phosphate 1-epimerase